MTSITAQFLEELNASHKSAAWDLFYTFYKPVLTRFGRNRGMRLNDAADFAQETLLRCYQSIHTFDRSRGRMCNWVFGVARHTMNDFFGRFPRGQAARDTVFWTSIEDEKAPHLTLRTEVRKLILDYCVKKVRREYRRNPAALRVLELSFYSDMTHSEIAREIGISEETVRTTKCRMLKRAREIREQLEELI